MIHGVWGFLSELFGFAHVDRSVREFPGLGGAVRIRFVVTRLADLFAFLVHPDRTFMSKSS